MDKQKPSKIITKCKLQSVSILANGTCGVCITEVKTKTKWYYYYHAESDSLWKSNLDFDEEGNPDGCTEPISKETAIKLKKRQKLKRIPKYINHKLISE